MWFKTVLLLMTMMALGGLMWVVYHNATHTEGFASSLGGELTGMPSVDQINAATDAHHGNTGAYGVEGGSKWDNYSHTSKDVTNGGGSTIYYGGQGYTAKLIRDPSGLLVAIEVSPPAGGKGSEYYYKDTGNVSIYKSASGGRVELSSSGGHLILQVMLPGTDTTMFMYDRNIYNQSSVPNADGISEKEGAGDPSVDMILPQGVPQSEIPKGHEDLYILKTQIPQPMISPNKDGLSIMPTSAKMTKESGKANHKPWPVPLVNTYTTFGM